MNHNIIITVEVTNADPTRMDPHDVAMSFGIDVGRSALHDEGHSVHRTTVTSIEWETA